LPRTSGFSLRRKIPPLNRSFRGTPRRAIPGPSRLSRHSCRSAPETPLQRGLLNGAFGVHGYSAGIPQEPERLFVGASKLAPTVGVVDGRIGLLRSPTRRISRTRSAPTASPSPYVPDVKPTPRAGRTTNVGWVELAIPMLWVQRNRWVSLRSTPSYDSVCGGSGRVRFASKLAPTDI
jgi:hypothetical protein